MESPLTAADIVLRLAAAAVAGSALGLNRDLHGKAAGIRTLSIVSLGAAGITLVAPLVAPANADALTRVIQGLVTAIGFLGAGVILHDDSRKKVHGLTTAVCCWFAVAVGIMCGIGLWTELVTAFVICILVLTVGGWVEKRLHQLLHVNLPDDET